MTHIIEAQAKRIVDTVLWNQDDRDMAQAMTVTLLNELIDNIASQPASDLGQLATDTAVRIDLMVAEYHNDNGGIHDVRDIVLASLRAVLRVTHRTNTRM